MYSYWYRDCRGKDVQGFERNKYIQEESLDNCMLFVFKEDFICFEWKHNPTSTRMVKLDYGKVIYGEWRS